MADTTDGVRRHLEGGRKAYVAPADLGVTGERLAGGWRCFRELDVVFRNDSGGRETFRLSPDEAIAAGLEDQLAKLTAPRPQFAGLDLDAPKIMGIVNVTPDSFSDGGDHSADRAGLRHAFALAAEGADLVDIGGESTRPGAETVSLEEELARVLPVIKGLSGEAVISVDTRHSEVMRQACRHGANIINDVTALEGEAGSLTTAAETGLPVMLMHMQGEPQTMQARPSYQDVTLDILGYLTQRIEACEAAGIPHSRICIDPGIGFGKTLDHNLQLLRELRFFHSLGCPVLLGASRKSFIDKLCPGTAPKDRLPGSLAAAMMAVEQGVQFIRVHDVAATRQAVTVMMHGLGRPG